MLCWLIGGGAPAVGQDEVTVDDRSREAFSQPLPSLAPALKPAFDRGRKLFRLEWAPAPGPNPAEDGLGPLFSRAACSGCHVKDGRGRPPSGKESTLDFMLLRLSVPVPGQSGAVGPNPVYGDQFQDKAILGVAREGRITVGYDERVEALADGEPVRLRMPAYRFDRLGYGPVGPDLLLSARVAPAVFGLGLIEAIDDSTIAALADPDDLDGDGISGRVNWLSDRAGGRVVGRFGWKANQPSLAAQIAAALVEDLGITTSLRPLGPCTPAQALSCGEASAAAPELAAAEFEALLLYIRALAVPARRGREQPAVVAGQALFDQAGCATCHRPGLPTGATAALAPLAGQRVDAYSDLLLHDLGPGLADGRADGAASGSEWRTPPLWGIGLIETVNRHRFLLHDGRARGFTEAILWHDGEAGSARAAFRAMTKDQRAALLAFLGSL